ncbi:c-type cytochrome biogenesis protein CcmI [Pseudoruegeria sp. SK021]|uniref:c-type cytochrome biogenesis protein CcmI n=1 Tax=Pseudoruegeria sp. SK021 TaxID=1933035 RepID=UPI000A22C965|nr:c-type cytochrome biogenesis protein CcmI [Pseudoruegeria sp. SK021]OSP56197.1 c-type cytochrome biogenesis protein CcmI [Pseudoruegeria sp. SK021]
MTFWILALLLAGLVTALLILVLIRNRGTQRSRSDFDLAVYRAQLDGVDRDLARGIVTDEAATRTRTEIARRILNADQTAEPVITSQAPATATRIAIGIVAAVLILGTWALYRQLGAPGYGDLPLAARLEASQALYATRPNQAEAERQAANLMPPPAAPDPQFAELMTQLRTALQDRPDDTRGLTLLARNEAALGNYAAAGAAQTRLVALLGDTAQANDFADLADLLILAAGGYVSPEAESALAQALERDPNNGPARYYSGLMFAQTDRPDLAFQIWSRLLNSSTTDEPWLPAIRDQIADIAARAGIRYSLPDQAAIAGLAGPSAADIDAAADMAPEDRMAMIQSMVTGLSDRLATQGGSPEEWARLIGALGVLGETDNARDIWLEARGVFAGNDAALTTLAAAAAQAGLQE